MRVETLAFDRSPRLAAKLRRQPRASVAITCQLRVDSTGWRPASLVDLSTEGFRIAWLPKCGIGRKLWIRLPGYEAMQATVRWRDNRGVGCQFDRPLHQSVIDHLCRSGRPHQA